MSHPSRIQASVRLALGLSACLVLGLLACDKKNNGNEDTPDAAVAETDAGETGDAGTPDAGPARCTNDDECPIDQRCGSNQRCEPAAPCQDTATCDTEAASKVYCDSDLGLGCRCVTSDKAPEPYTGFCKRRLPACSTCTSDEQCGVGPDFDTFLHKEGRCVAFGGSKVCLEYFGTTCECGKAVTIDGKAFCAPQNDQCQEGQPFLCCKYDDQCPSEYPICSDGLCKDVCSYDFANKETVNCADNQVCNVLPGFLDPTKKTFGSGECSAPCETTEQCVNRYKTNVLVCKAEADGAKRCRPDGCINDFECAQPANDGPFSMYKGYCALSGDHATECACSDFPCDCRVGMHPVTGVKYDDCSPGFKCVCLNPDDVECTGRCVEKNCVDEGGAENACKDGEFCCGQDRNNDGVEEPCTDFDGTVVAQFGKCYKAPNPPWCLACQKNDECNAPGFPQMSRYDANACLDNMCMYGCELLATCPVGFGCNEIFAQCTLDAEPNECGAKDRCVQIGVTPEGDPITRCKCGVTQPYQTGGDCPAQTRCQGNGEFCVYGQWCQPRDPALSCQ